MTVITCECGGNVNTRATACPHCGNPGPFEAPKPSRRRSATLAEMVTAVLLTLIGLAVLMVLET